MKKVVHRIGRLRPQSVPREYGGKWIAWTTDGLRIVGVGTSPEEARGEAARAGVTTIAYEWVPPANERFIGGSG